MTLIEHDYQDSKSHFNQIHLFMNQKRKHKLPYVNLPPKRTTKRYLDNKIKPIKIIRLQYNPLSFFP